MIKITTHTLVKNEENFIWFALNSVRKFATEMLVFDDNSTDKTAEILNSIRDPKLKVTRGTLTTAGDIRNTMLKETKTDWFLLLDGDEVWNEKTLEKLLDFLEDCPRDVWGVVMRTRNCIGDVYHYQPESAGQYTLLGRKGNLNIRAYRKLPNLQWCWDYPRETYCDLRENPINNQDAHLRFFDDHYWHMTYLPRTSSTAERKHPQRLKTEWGIKIKNVSELPEVFFVDRPSMVPNPLQNRRSSYTLRASLVSPLLRLKRSLQ